VLSGEAAPLSNSHFQRRFFQMSAHISSLTFASNRIANACEIHAKQNVGDVHLHATLKRMSTVCRDLATHVNHIKVATPAAVIARAEQLIDEHVDREHPKEIAG
jgi:hypothetical protein